jgi:hypothetical protein
MDIYGNFYLIIHRWRNILGIAVFYLIFFILWFVQLFSAYFHCEMHFHKCRYCQTKQIFTRDEIHICLVELEEFGCQFLVEVNGSRSRLLTLELMCYITIRRE